MPVSTKTQRNNKRQPQKRRDTAGSYNDSPGQNKRALALEGGDFIGEDDAIADFFQEGKQEEVKPVLARNIRKASIIAGQKHFKLGPEYIDEDFIECTPVPLYPQNTPIFDYNAFLEKSPEEIVTIPPIRPQTFSALFEFYRDRSPALNWTPSLTDVEEDCFYQEVVNFPTDKVALMIPRQKKQKLKKKWVKSYKPNGDFVVQTRIYVDLVETPTISLLEIKGSLTLKTDPEYDVIRHKNEKHMHRIERRRHEADSFIERSTQTFENYKCDAYTDYKITGCNDVGVECHRHDIEDEYRQIAAQKGEETIVEDEESLKSTETKETLHETIPETGRDSDSDVSVEDNDIVSGKQAVDITLYMEEEKLDEETLKLIQELASEDELPMSEEDQNEFEIQMQLRDVYETKRHRIQREGPRMYPDVSSSIIALERIMCMHAQQDNQADMRGLLKDHDEKSESEPSGSGETAAPGEVTIIGKSYLLDEASDEEEYGEGLEDEEGMGFIKRPGKPLDEQAGESETQLEEEKEVFSSVHKDEDEIPSESEDEEDLRALYFGEEEEETVPMYRSKEDDVSSSSSGEDSKYSDSREQEEDMESSSDDVSDDVYFSL